MTAIANVYPRVCGGNAHPAAATGSPVRLSPRVRGKPCALARLVRAGQASEGCPALCLSRANLTEGLLAAGTPVGFAAACLDYSVAALAACGIWAGYYDAKAGKPARGKGQGLIP